MHSWGLVVPLKLLDVAKSRLAPAAGPRRADLALAMAADTVEAALRSPAIAGVVVVTDDVRAAVSLRDLGAAIVPDLPDSGLNPALRHGARLARRDAPSVAALSADLPALRSGTLTAVLAAANQHRVAFLADHAGTGTTLYAATVPEAFAPRFGPASAERHREAGAVELRLPDAATVRRDVDTGSDLVAAGALGLGPRTRTVAAELGLLPAPSPTPP